MDETKVKFGDKLFLYGSLLQLLPEDGDFQYNTVKGYMTINSVDVINVDSVSQNHEIAGFVVDFMATDSFTSQTLFARMEMIDVTDSLSRRELFPAGTKVWMPTPSARLYS